MRATKSESAREIRVDPELCTSCGACVDLAPAWFGWNAVDQAEVIRQPTSAADHVQVEAAMSVCPTAAIVEVKGAR